MLQDCLISASSNALLHLARADRRPAPETHRSVAAILLALADESIGWTSRDAALQEMLQYIAELERENLLPIDRPKEQRMNPLLEESAFGLGFVQRETAEFEQICTTLVEALDRAFWAVNPRRAGELLDLAATDVEDFVSMIDNRGHRDGLPNYAHLPVLTGADPSKAAQVIFGLHPDRTRQVLAPFKDRIRRLENTPMEERNAAWPSERDWLVRFRAEAECLALEAPSPIRAAQIRSLIRGGLGFLDGA